MECFEEIFEKVLRDQILLDGSWEKVLILRLVFEDLNSIIEPEVLKVLLYLLLESFWNGLSIFESLNCDKEIVEVTLFVNMAHFP